MDEFEIVEVVTLEGGGLMLRCVKPADPANDVVQPEVWLRGSLVEAWQADRPIACGELVDVRRHDPAQETE